MEAAAAVMGCNRAAGAGSARRHIAALLITWLAFVPTAAAVDGISVRLAEVRADNWQASGIHLTLALPGEDSAVAGALRVERLVLPPPLGERRGVRVRCESVALDAGALTCDPAVLLLPRPDDGEPWHLRGRLRYDPAASVLELALTDVSSAPGTLSAEARWSAREWRVELDGKAVPASRLPGLWPAPLGDPPVSVTSGKVDLDLTLTAQGGLPTVRGTVRLHDVSAGNASGRQAVQDLTLHAELSLTPGKAGWAFASETAVFSGQAYVDPVFVDFKRRMARLEVNARWVPGSRTLTLDRLVWDQPGALVGEASLRLALDRAAPLRRLDANVKSLRFPAGYEFFLQPFLLGTPLDALDTVGQLSGSLRIRSGHPAVVTVGFDQVYLSDRRERFVLNALDGVVHWADEAAPPSRLSWDGGFVFGMPMGATDLLFALESAGGRLLRSASIPLLDGAIVVERLAARALGSPDAALDLRTRLEPISMRALSRALGWPPFTGMLSGRLPALHYRGGVLTTDGPLVARVFGGRLAVRHLRLEHLFGLVPNLRADITLDSLDLAGLSEAFSFGLISGRLDGQVRNLRLVGWSPAAFDARFHTPRNDPAPRRISQRAIRNLSSLGGGATAILSRGFLSYFSDFAYDRIALGCRLDNGVCIMSGLEPTPHGFLIVRGAGLPRVSVIGHNRQVNWSRLVEQLRAAARGEGPVVR